MKKHILIAGGAGFIGANLCRYYINNGDSVTCIDSLITGRRNNLIDLESNNKFVFSQVDICKPLPRKITNQKYDVIINLASPASPPKYQRLALETLKVGSLGTQNLLELTKKNQARFLHASTSEIYGEPEIHPQVESYYGNVNPYGPRSMYDEAKRFSETLVYVYKQSYGINSAIVRIFNTYGPAMEPDDGRVVSNFITQALGNKPITIYGNGDQTRSFCYVDDMISGIVALIESNEEGPMNIGNPEEHTILDLAQTILKMVRSNSPIKYMPLRINDPKRRRPDISYAQSALNWEPKISLKVGLENTIAYFRLHT